MRVCDRPHDREPETGSTRRADTRGVDAMKTTKDALALLERDSRPVVFDEEAHPPTRTRLYAQAHEPVLGSRVLDRVADQVAQRLRETVWVSPQSAGW